MKAVTTTRIALLLVLGIALSGCGGGSGNESNESNPDGNGDSSEPVLNAAPVIGSFSATPANLLVGGSTLYEWTISADDAGLLTCEIDVNSDGIVEYSLAACPTVGNMSHSFDDVGAFNGSIVVTDASGLTATATAVVAVSPVAGDAPIVSSLSVSPTSVTAGNPVTVSWEIVNPGDSALSCELDADGDGASEFSFNPCPISGSQELIYSAEGSFNLNLTATADNGASATNSTAVSVSVPSGSDGGNSPPLISEFTAEPGTVMIDEPVTFTWQISDPDIDSLSCAIDVDGNGFSDISIDNCASGQSVVHHYLETGDFEPVLTVSDSDGLQDQSTTDVRVLPLQVSLAATNSVVAGGRLRLEYTVSNVSLVPVNDVAVLFRVPPGLSFVRTTDVIPDAFGCGTCVEGEEASWSFDSIAPGVSRTIIINASVLEDNLVGSVISGNMDLTASGFNETISVSSSADVTSQPDVVVGISASRDPLLAGESLELVVNLGNISAANLSNLEARVALPRNVTVVDISDGGSQESESGDVVWNLSQLPVLQTRRLTMTVTGPIDSVPGQILTFGSAVFSSGTNVPASSASDVVVISERPSPIQIDISTQAAPVRAGGRLSYQITVSNTGLIPVTNVGVVVRVPLGFSFVRTTDAFPDAFGCGTCMEGEEGNWTFDSIAAGGSRTIIINGAVSSSLQGGSLIDTMFFVFFDNASSYISRSNVTGLNNAPVSQLGVSVTQDPVLAGQDFSVTVDAGNISNTNQNNAVVSLQLPPGVTASQISDGGSQSGESGAIVWPAQTLPVLAGLRYNATLTAPADALSGQSLPIRGELTHDGGPELDASAEQVLTISGMDPPLDLELLPASFDVASGGRVLYQFLVTNVSLIPLRNVALLYRVPGGVSFVRTTDAEPDATGCGTCMDGEEASWVFPEIQPGETVTIRVNINISSQLQAGNLIDNRVVVTASDVEDTVSLSSVLRVN